jgi:hypothetical protein
MTVQAGAFVFNLGRLWQEVISEQWAEVVYLYDLIGDTTASSQLKKYSKELKRIQSAIKREDSQGVSRALETILGW